MSINDKLSGFYTRGLATGTCFNPLSPDIKMRILLTVLHIFLMKLVRRMCVNVETLILGDRFLYSHHLNV